MKTYHIITYGCQMNENDSEKLAGILTSMGYAPIESPEDANILIMNTCSVRENADDKFFGHLGYYKKNRTASDEKILAVCGCMMQQTEIVSTIRKKYPFVDIIFGTHNIHLFGQMLSKHLQTGEMICDIWDDIDHFEENIPVKREYIHKAYITIMNGCNNFCSYCIVPFTRGREKSRESSSIITEIKELAQNGCKEVMLLGQNVNSYGKTLNQPKTFASLLEDVSDIDGIERIRFMTSHPKDLTDDIISIMKERENICNHVHLPLQSGSNRILSEMNRHYSRESYLALADKLRNAIPDLAISTDIIVGFPTETEDDFLATLDMINKCRFDAAFTFIYSPRNGTKAAQMDQLFGKDVIQNRFNRLLELQYQIMLENAQRYKGRALEVIAEGISKTDPQMMSGRTKTNKLVNFSGSCQIGDTVTIIVTDALTFHLTGKMIN